MNYLFIIFSYFIIYYFLYNLSPKINLFDQPNSRKIHKNNIPLIGGICIFIPFYFSSYFFEQDQYFFIIAFSSIPIFIIGIMDDLIEISYFIRLIAQILSTLIVISFGLLVKDFGIINNEIFYLGYFGLIITIISVISYTTAFNFIDGLDGLSSSISFFTLVCILTVSYIETGTLLLTNIHILLILLFLFFFSNIGLFKGKIFLGDAGSQTLGFYLSWTIIYLSSDVMRLMSPLFVVWLTCLPIFDLVTVIISRLRNKTNILNPQKDHIHHLLIEKKFNNSSILILLNLFVIISVIIGYLIHFYFGNVISLICFSFYFLIYFIFINKFKEKNELKNL